MMEQNLVLMSLMTESWKTRESSSLKPITEWSTEVNSRMIVSWMAKAFSFSKMAQRSLVTGLTESTRRKSRKPRSKSRVQHIRKKLQSKQRKRQRLKQKSWKDTESSATTRNRRTLKNGWTKRREPSSLRRDWSTLWNHLTILTLHRLNETINFS